VLTKIEEFGIYRVTVYEGTNNEYHCYTTRECAAAIDDYLAYRQRSGERISASAPLIREQFDSTDVLQARRPQHMNTNAIRRSLGYHLVKCGLRTVEHPQEPNSVKRVRKDVALGNGFRKYAISCFVRAKVNHEVRQMLVDHKGGYLDESYLRLSEEEILSEYLKAEPYLTLDPNVRLSQENKTLKIEVSKVDGVLKELAELRQQIGLE
jgi:hypothetical protein